MLRLNIKAKYASLLEVVCQDGIHHSFVANDILWKAGIIESMFSNNFFTEY
jgi:hypothetical protein